MNLRKLKFKDAPYMLEWMHDKSVTKYLQANFAGKTMKDCEDFILASTNITNNLHLAVVDENDIYMGTVSLKHIINHTAEFAITIRAIAMGKGYSQYGMSEIFHIGFEKLNLSYIYWCVSPENKRALKFYDRNGYQKMNPSALNIQEGHYSDTQIKQYIWYQKTKPHDVIFD